MVATGAYGHLGVSALQTATALRAKCLEPSGSPFVDREGDEQDDDAADIDRDIEIEHSVLLALRPYWKLTAKGSL